MKENGAVITLTAWSQLCPAAPLWGWCFSHYYLHIPLR